MKTVRTILIVVFLFLLAACANFSGMKRGLQALQGKNITEATDLLGEPDNIEKEKDFDAYIWSYKYQKKTSNKYGAGTPQASAEVGEPTDMRYANTCWIKLDVNDKGEIFGWHFKGNKPGCGWTSTGWIQKLENYGETHSK